MGKASCLPACQKQVVSARLLPILLGIFTSSAAAVFVSKIADKKW